jgi:DNA polymerase I-like protein with 3'-5' exonuclease and polymerase domains
MSVCRAEVMDIMLLQHLRFSEFPHDLEFISSQFTSKPAWKQDAGVHFEKYCARDTDVTLQSYYALMPLIEEANLLDVYKYVSVPLGMICRGMFRKGFKVDPSRITEVRKKLLEEQARLELDIPAWLRSHEITVNRREHAPAGTKSEKTGKPLKFITVPAQESVVPWRSTTQKIKFLYGKEDGCLGLERQFDPKKGTITTGKIALDKLTKRVKDDKARRSIVALKRLNALDEMLTTFCKEGMVGINRMHPHFNVHGTSSGRLSSSDPNLQNIPEPARCIYVPSHPGWEIMDVDYSQLENRLTAWFANDHERAKRLEDPDFSEHKYAASLFVGVPYDEVVKDNDKDAPYGKAKRIVHGTNYGMGPQKIVNLYDMDLKETKRLQSVWKDAIRESVRWQARCAEEAKQNGFLCNPFQRRRWFWTSSYFTESLSFLPQSTGADIVFRAMIGLMYRQIGWPEEYVRKVVRVYEPLPEGVSLLLQVHDSLIFEYRSELRDEVARIVTKVLTQPWSELGGLSIPIGIQVGPSWGDVEKYKGAVA